MIISSSLRKSIFVAQQRGWWTSLIRTRCEETTAKCPVVGRQDKLSSATTVKEEPVVSGSGGPTETDQLWQRPVRQEPPKVRMGFLPEDWFQFFYPKTGVTGPYVFMTTVSTYVISKEKYVMEHEYYWGISVVIALYLVHKHLGPAIAAYLDKEVDEYEEHWEHGRREEKRILKEQIEDEQKLQKSADGQFLLLDAKRENVALQYEEAYRKRLLVAHEAVKRRLDFQVRQNMINRRYLQENAVEWIVDQVLKSYTEKHADEHVDICIECLKELAAKKVGDSV